MSDMPQLINTNATILAVHSENRPLHESLAMAWLAGYEVKHTRDTYLLSIRQWFDWCARCDVDPLAAVKAHVDLWMRQLEGELSARTVNQRISCLSSFYVYCVEQEVLHRNPTKGVRRPKVTKKSPTGWLTRPQLADLIAGAEALGPHAYALVLLLGLNGLRISEACGVDVDGLRYVDHYPQLAIRRKGGEYQWITLARPAEHAVVACIADRKSGPLLLNTIGNRMSQQAAQRILDKAVLSIRGEHDRVTPHVLRHSWTAIALDAGANHEQIRHDGGWASMEMVSYYGNHGRDAPVRSVTHAVAGIVLSS